MADREPPPLFGDDDENPDIFASASQSPPKDDPVKDQDDDQEDLFADAGTEISLDDDSQKEKAPEQHLSEPDPEDEDIMTTPQEEAPKMGVSEASTSGGVSKTSVREEKAKDIDEDDEEYDDFTLSVSISDPIKVGDGMGAYMTYKVTTMTTIPAFKKPETSVMRRFSDFLGLHEKLCETYAHQGRIIPPAPEKSVIGMTKIKMSKEEASSADFVERRRAALERYVNRTATHPILRNDPTFREFLEQEGDLPRSTSTSALSGAGVLRLFNKMGDAVGKMTFKMDETDQWDYDFEWFEEKQTHFENLDLQLRKLHTSVETIVSFRKELGVSTATFAKSCAMLANSEEHTALSRALSQLAEIEEKIEQLHSDQADTDFFVLAEMLKDYISLIGAVKETFAERVKMYKTWKDAEAMLTKKREVKVRLELSGKTDKIAQASNEITEWEGKVERGQEDFEKISETIRKEVSRFDKRRVKDFQQSMIKCLDSLMETQQKLIKYWESFVPEAKAIA
ncbi:sorting nexin-2-like isoform X2 [Lineus longissimus]|uniref:sorting nexin-2-like isoform X2 n=1 Tax=Lineus longissimus TaxID=88925 RepID=UPI00315CC228